MSAFIDFTLAGLALGAIYAISASGLVVTYTTSGVFNFAHGAIGMLMAFVYWQLRFHQHWPAPLAGLVVIFVAAPLLGALIERSMIRKLNINDTGTTLVVTLGLMVTLIGVCYLIWIPTINRTLPPFFGAGAHLTAFGHRITYMRLVTVGVAALVAGSLRLLFYRTRVGIAMRAVVDDRDLTALNGVTPAKVSLLSWAIGASLAALAGVLQASISRLEVLSLVFLVVNGFAAAMVGRLKNLPLTFAGALCLGLLNAYVVGYVPLHGYLQELVPALPTLFLFAVLLVLPAVRLRTGRVVGTREPRVASAQQSALAAVSFDLATAVVVNLLHGTSLTAAGQGMAIGIVGLSLVLLTGYGGQVSLCQYTFLGVGAFVFAKVAAHGNPLGLLIVAAVGAVVGAVVALPALRLQGLYLALSTLAFGQLAYYMFFLEPQFMGRSSLAVHRLTFPFVSVAGDRANVVMLSVFFAAFSCLVLAIRRGPFGRLLGAMKDSPAACATLGLNLTMTKMGVFALSTSIAAVGGALYGASEHSVNGQNFQYIYSLLLLLIVYVWGIKSPSGALMGGLALAIFPLIEVHLPERFRVIAYVATGLGAISLGRNPNGIMGQASGAWEQVRAGLGSVWPDRRVARGLAVREEIGVVATAD